MFEVERRVVMMTKRSHSFHAFDCSGISALQK
jgi:hypothetical protein